MVRKFELPFKLVSKPWLFVSMGLYVFSTIGLSGGVSTASNIAEGFISDAAIIASLQVVQKLSLLIAIIIQVIETMMTFTWNDGAHDAEDKIIAYALYTLDFLFLNLVLGNHFILVRWMYGGMKPDEIIVSVIVFVANLVIAYLGAIFAEKALTKAIEWTPSTAMNFKPEAKSDGGDPYAWRDGESRDEHHARLRDLLGQPAGSAPVSVAHPAPEHSALPATDTHITTSESYMPQP